MPLGTKKHYRVITTIIVSLLPVTLQGCSQPQSDVFYIPTVQWLTTGMLVLCAFVGAKL